MQENNDLLAQNKMGHVPVGKLLLQMSVPMAISMLVQALYNIIDSMFVAQISENALTAVSLAFPVQNFIISMGVGTAVGVNAILSKSLGEKNQKLVNASAENGLSLMGIYAIFFAILGLLFSRIFFTLQTDNQAIIDYGTQYTMVVTIWSVGCFIQVIGERLLVSTGKTHYAMITQITGAVINVVLDPILIFGIGPFPRMEVVGAAVATVFAQTVAGLLALYLGHKKNTEIQLDLKKVFRPSGLVIKRILAVGVPSICMMSIGSIMVLLLNVILNTFTSTAVAVFGVYFKLQGFAIMPCIGINNGMVPIIAYNYGARNKTRVMQTIKFAVLYSYVVLVVAIAIFQIFPSPILKIFNATPEMMAIGVPALRIISLCWFFAGLCIVFGSVFQALGSGVSSLIVSFGRQLVVLVPAAFLLSLTGSVTNVWWSFPIAECMSLLLSIIFMKRIYRLKIHPLELPIVDDSSRE
ncbi:MAG: MATE family efflux transporter [Clostridiales Family XIII bacterium]|jgi:putative MATE family efflux protein|nr:MATE family efflux transporter [Clostridiales Family XIII bacterium]